MRPFGITSAPLLFDPPVVDFDLQGLRLEIGGKPREEPCWLPERPSSLPHLEGIPILIVTGEASYHSAYDHCTSGFLSAAGAKNTWLRLGVVGIHGNGHMMMIEKNNNEVAGAIYRWLIKSAS